MDQPVTSPTQVDPSLTGPTADMLSAQARELRARATDLHEAAKRASVTRSTERGGDLDKARVAATAARSEAESAFEQADTVRDDARQHLDEAEARAEAYVAGGLDPDTIQRARQEVDRQRALVEVAEERFDRLVMAGHEAAARADQLDQEVARLESITGDDSVSQHLRGAADQMDQAIGQIEEKARLLNGAADMDRDAADYEAQGDTLNAELARGEADAVRARAAAIQPQIPEVDQRIVDAAGQPSGPEDGPGTAQPPADGQQPVPLSGPSGPMQPIDPYPDAGQPPADGQQPVPSTGPSGPMQPIDRYPDAGQPPADGQQPVPLSGPSGPMQPIDPYAKTDDDDDGLSNEVERRLGTNPRDDDTDGDGRKDGFEVGTHYENPRARGAEDLSPAAFDARDKAVADFEARRGIEHNADSDGDGFADWVEHLRDSTRRPTNAPADPANLTAGDIENNLSPLDQFMHTALAQKEVPYRLGADTDPAGTVRARELDSGELVELAAKQAGVRGMPDGTWRQYKWLTENGGKTSVDAALHTKGALVFGFSEDPTTTSAIPSTRFVAISMGDGRNVLEVNEATGEVTQRPADLERYEYAAKIPELHNPQGDLDGDGWSDKEELQFGADPSRSVTWSKDLSEVHMEGQAPDPGDGQGSGTTDRANPANPATPSGPANPANPSGPTNPVDPASPSGGGNPFVPPNPLDPANPSGAVNPPAMTDPATPSGGGNPFLPPNPLDPMNPSGAESQGDPVNPVDPAAQDGTDPAASSAGPGAGDGTGDPLGTGRYPMDESYDAPDTGTGPGSYDQDPGAVVADTGSGAYGATEPYGAASTDAAAAYEPAAVDPADQALTGSGEAYVASSSSGSSDDDSGDSESYDTYYSDASTYEA